MLSRNLAGIHCTEFWRNLTEILKSARIKVRNSVKSRGIPLNTEFHKIRNSVYSEFRQICFSRNNGHFIQNTNQDEENPCLKTVKAAFTFIAFEFLNFVLEREVAIKFSFVTLDIK